VLEDGQVVEQGSPVELVGRTGGRYAILHGAWEESLASGSASSSMLGGVRFSS
jgi:hypothetical protein